MSLGTGSGQTDAAGGLPQGFIPWLKQSHTRAEQAAGQALLNSRHSQLSQTEDRGYF